MTMLKIIHSKRDKKIDLLPKVSSFEEFGTKAIEDYKKISSFEKSQISFGKENENLYGQTFYNGY